MLNFLNFDAAIKVLLFELVTCKKMIKIEFHRILISFS